MTHVPYRLGRGAADSEPIAAEAVVEINQEKLMFEWVLLFALTLKTTPGENRDISLVIVQGFTSRERCTQAGELLARQTIVLAGRARKQQGVRDDTSAGIPSINFECLQIQK